jgi:hypothetical protein
MKLDAATDYFRARAAELQRTCADGTPWVFLMSSAFLEYLAKLANGKDKSKQRRTGYKSFICEYLAEVRPRYRDFEYKSGTKDLPTQMYHILRCGIVHNFSLVPGKEENSSRGRIRSIVLCHAKERDEKKWEHLMNYGTAEINDAALFVAEDFTQDIEKVTELLLSKAKDDGSLRKNVEEWLENHPPIAGGF